MFLILVFNPKGLIMRLLSLLLKFAQKIRPDVDSMMLVPDSLCSQFDLIDWHMNPRTKYQ